MGVMNMRLLKSYWGMGNLDDKGEDSKKCCKFQKKMISFGLLCFLNCVKQFHQVHIYGKLVVWGPVVWIPGDSLVKRIVILKGYPASNPKAPGHKPSIHQRLISSLLIRCNIYIYIHNYICIYIYITQPMANL